MSTKTQSVNWDRAASEDVWAELDRYRKALEFIAAHAGQTLISTEHGQPYSIGANVAFDTMADVAQEALKK